MNYIKLRKAAFVLAAMMMTTSAYAYNEMEAKLDCANAVARGGQYYQASHEHAASKGHHSYKVTGKVKSRHNNSTHNFSCNVRHGEVVNWHVSDSRHSNKDTAASVGAGIIAIAALAALANADKHANHDTGGSAFDDIRYLKRQCKQNLRHHINGAHGRVNKIRLNTAHLHRKSLNGRGLVIFARGGERELDYNCVFDRRGHIRDGHYQFGRFR